MEEILLQNGQARMFGQILSLVTQVGMVWEQLTSTKHRLAGSGWHDHFNVLKTFSKLLLIKMRIKMKRIMLAAGVVYLFAAAGCKKGYLDINQNPNNPADVAPELVLPAALNSTAARQINSFTFVSGWMGQWAVSGSYAPSTSNFTTYKETTDFGGGLWGNIYNTLEDYQYVETKSADLAATQPDKAAYYGFYQGASKIMKSHDFQQLVDMFGMCHISMLSRVLRIFSQFTMTHRRSTRI
jgi:hypothetical protein